MQTIHMEWQTYFLLKLLRKILEYHLLEFCLLALFSPAFLTTTDKEDHL